MKPLQQCRGFWLGGRGYVATGGVTTLLLGAKQPEVDRWAQQRLTGAVVMLLRDRAVEVLPGKEVDHW